MPKLHQFKYEIGYRYLHYEIVDTVSRLYDCGSVKYFYIVKCLKCGNLIDRTEREINQDIKCQECMRRMEYSKFDVGDIVNGLRILEKTPISAKNGRMARAYLCTCLVDGYQSVHTEHNLEKGKGCPVCAGIVTMKGVNDIHTKAPWIGELLVNYDDGYKYSIGTKTKLSFKCPYCGEVTSPLIPYQVYTSGHVPCRKCGDGISMPEKLLYGILRRLDIEFEYQKQFEWSKKKVYDFYIPRLNMIIETHGRQHYVETKSSRWDTLESTRNNDDFKKTLALQNGIEHYITVNCSDCSPLSLIDAYKSSLSQYFNLDSVNFNDVVLDAYKSFCIKVGDTWNNGTHNVDDIASAFKLNPTTIRRYLRTLSKIGYLNVTYPIKINTL